MSEEKTTVPIEKYREVLSQSAMKDAEIEQLTNKVKDIEFVLERIKSEKASIDQADRNEAIDLLVSLSKGKIPKESLKDTPNETINRMVETAVKITPPSAISLMRQAEIDAAKPPALGANGTGTLNQQTGKWEGGAPE